MNEQRFISLVSRLIADMITSGTDIYDVVVYLLGVGFSEHELITYFGFSKRDVNRAKTQVS